MQLLVSAGVGRDMLVVALLMFAHLTVGTAATADGALPQLPPPQDLRVDLLTAPAIGVASEYPMFTFSPAVASPSTDRNVTVASARVQIFRTCSNTNGSGPVWWDSGDVAQQHGPGSPPPGVRYGRTASLFSTVSSSETAAATATATAAAAESPQPLPSLTSFCWQVQWTATDGRTSMPSSPARFVTAALTEQAWQGAKWVRDALTLVVRCKSAFCCHALEQR